MNDGAPVLIPHIDDLACAHGANVAFFERPDHSLVTCGSVMVPPTWFPHAAARCRGTDADLGVHLTLTSESAAARWPPISTRDPATGLLDEHGYLWPTVPELRARADPAAVDIERRAQIDRAHDAGIDVTHLDHHMGAALSPEFAEITARIARDYEIPILFPEDIDGYLAVLKMGEVDSSALRTVRESLVADDLAVADRFVMGLAYQDAPDAKPVLEDIIGSLEAGVTYFSLHCASPGDIEAVHPKDAHWRVAEHEVFRTAAFSDWVRSLSVVISGMREFRDARRSSS